MFWLFWFLAATIVLLLFLWLPAPNARRAMATLTRKSYAHRGLHNKDAGIPENSLPAFEHAVKNGYGIELDVQLTADHCLVVFHDDDTQRMCGKQLIVSQSTMDELWQLRLGNTKERIPLLEDVLRVVGGRVPLIIEIKYQKRYPQLCKALMVQLEGYRGKYCIESFHPFVVRWLYKHVPQVPRGILSMNYAKEEKWRGDPVYFAAKYLLTNVMCRPILLLTATRIGIIWDFGHAAGCLGLPLWHGQCEVRKNSKAWVRIMTLSFLKTTCHRRNIPSSKAHTGKRYGISSNGW